MRYTREQLEEMSNEDLVKISLEKGKNGNASRNGHLAQVVLYGRPFSGRVYSSPVENSKRYSVYADYIDGKYETLEY